MSRLWFAGFIALFLIGLQALVQPVSAQEDLQLMMTRAQESEQVYSALLKEKTSLENLSRELGKRIDEMKREGDGENLYPWNRYQLEDLLKRAQDIGERLQLQNIRTEDSQKEFRIAVESILDRYDDMIAGATLEWKAHGTREGGERLQGLILARSEWRKKLPVRGFGNLVIVDVQVDESDGPFETREKADLLRDMADKVKQEVQRLDKRRKELLDEIKLRNDVAEFLEEVAVFKPRQRGNLQDTPQLSKPAVSSVEDLDRDFLFRLVDNYDLIQEMGLSSEHVPSLVQQYDRLMQSLLQQAVHMFYRAEELYENASAMEEGASWQP